MLRNRDVMRVVAARFISRVGGEAAFFVGVWGKAAYELHANAGQIAILMAVLAVSGILGTMVAGVLVDRYDPRRVLAIAELFFVPTALAFLLPTQMWQLTVLAALLGFFGSPVMTASASFAPFLTTEDAPIERVNAWIEGAGSLSFVIGPGLGALLAAYVSLDAVFILDAVTSLIAVFLVWGVHLNRAKREPGQRGRAVEELREGLRYVYGNRALRYPVLIGTAVWLGFGAFGALEPLFYRDVLEVGVEAIGYMNTIFGLGLVGGAWLSTRLPERTRSARGLAVVSSLVGFGALLYVGTRSLLVVALGALVWGAVIGVADVLLKVLIQSSTPDHLMGRAVGAAQMHRQGGELLPLAVAPSLAAAFGVQAVLIGGGLVLAGAAALSWGEARAVDRLPRLRTAVVSGSLSPDDEPVSPVP
ncbi:MAG: MFS transporter [Coriobacteriia bacterium]|nr:MFS transporter [Coriobacteriia bacterium]